MRGLAWRTGLLLIGTLVLIAVIAAGLIIANRRNAMIGLGLPSPMRVAAIVGLVEATPRAQLSAVLDALNSPELSVSVINGVPATRAVVLPGRALALKAYAGLQGRQVQVMADASSLANRPVGRWAWRRMLIRYPVQITVSLSDGRTLVLMQHGAFSEQINGLRLSFLVLLTALAIGGVSLFILLNQIRPIERLAAAVERFGTNMEASALPERGAREVRQLTAAFNRLQSQIAILVAGRTRMMAAISHDLGTYLTRLRLRAEFITDPEQRERAARDIADMHALMTDTLTMAKFDHDSEGTSPTDLVELVRNVSQRFESAGGKLVFHAEAPQLMARVRPTVIRRIFENLISNAFKYGQEAEITMWRQGDVAEILVDDRGPGIPLSEREAVLEPFYRRDASRNLDERGFGLGLAIVADIVRRHGGTLSLEDRPGGGLRARVRLPIG